MFGMEHTKSNLFDVIDSGTPSKQNIFPNNIFYPLLHGIVVRGHTGGYSETVSETYPRHGHVQLAVSKYRVQTLSIFLAIVIKENSVWETNTNTSHALALRLVDGHHPGELQRELATRESHCHVASWHQGFAFDTKGPKTSPTKTIHG
jgi:hypothetical protein